MILWPTEPPHEHDCQCGSRARVWVPVGLANPEPLCRACAARAAEDDAFRARLADAHSGPSDYVLPPFRVVSPPQPAVVSPPRRSTGTRAEAGRRALAIKRRCLAPGCSMVTSPPSLALHQRAAGHEGWEAR